MPKLPIYDSKHNDRGEICPHNKVVTTIRTPYKCRDSPIRLKDVCQMRKLGDSTFRPESECESCNYLWSVTLRAGANPYERVQWKKDLPPVSRWSRQHGMLERMRNSFRRCCEQLTTTSKHYDNDKVEWLLKPRELKNDSSHEDVVWPQHRWSKRKRRDSVQAAPPAHDGGKRCVVAKAEFSTHHKKLSLSAHFEEALRKCKKNMENEQKKRKVGGEESTNTMSVPRKTVIVKKQLADSAIKRAPSQKTEKDEARSGNKKHAVKYIRFNVGTKQNDHSPQRQTTHVTLMPPISPSPPLLELSTSTSKNYQLPALDLNDCAQQQLSDIPTLCPCESSCARIESVQLSSCLGKPLCKGLAETYISLQQRLAQAFPKPKTTYKPYNADTLQHVQRASKKSEEKAHKALRAGGAVSRKKTYRRHYRTIRRRAKPSSKTTQDTQSLAQHIDKETQCSSNESAGLSSVSCITLSEHHQEMENWLKSKKEQIEREYDMVNTLPATVPTRPPDSATKMEPVSSDFIISFHKPITLRDLIQRKSRGKRAKVAQPTTPTLGAELPSKHYKHCGAAEISERCIGNKLKVVSSGLPHHAKRLNVVSLGRILD